MQELSFNQFVIEFLKWTLPFLNLDISTAVNRGYSVKSKTEWQTVKILMRWLVTFFSWIHCKDMFWSAELKRLILHKKRGYLLEVPCSGASNEYLYIL